jgi:carboxypeptidase Q
MSKRTLIAGAIGLCLAAALPLTAQAPPNLQDVYAQIKAEETNDSKIMWIIHEIADVYGPRLTGTPNLKRAQDWAVKTMTSWGLQNAHLEPWTFQPPSSAKPAPGWANLELVADAVKPFTGQLIVKPLAWTPGMKAPATTEVVLLDPPGLGGGGALAARGGGRGRGGEPQPTCEESPAQLANQSLAWAPPPMPPAPEATAPQMPTQAELDAYLNSMKAKVRGHFVMVGKHIEVPENCYPAPLRLTEE